MPMWNWNEDATELSRQGVEVWKPLADCPERYWVSNLSLTLTRAGYPSVGVYARKGERPQTRLVHQMGVPPVLVDARRSRRAEARKAEIRALVREGLGFKDISGRLGETLTAQALYYYRTTTRK